MTKNYRLLSYLFLLSSCLLFLGCKRDAGLYSKASASNSSTTDAEFIQNHTKSDLTLSDTSAILAQLYNSDAWKTIPQNILESIKNKSTPNLQTYDNSPIRTINFNIAGSDPNIHYKLLSVYEYKGKFLPIIIQNIMLNSGYRQVSMSDISGNSYIHFLVDKNDKFGEFKIEKEIPWEGIIGEVHRFTPKQALPNNGRSVKQVDEAPPVSDGGCPSTTATFGACMNCCTTTCLSSFACSVAFAAETPGVLLVWAAACAFAGTTPS